MRKWKNFLIYPRFQLTLFFVNIGILLTVFFIFYAQVRRSFDTISEMGLELGLPSDHVFFSFMQLQQQHLMELMMGALFLAFVASSVISLVLSHQLAGPIVRLRNHLKSFVQTKKFERLHFRKNDFFQDIPELYNQALSPSSQMMQKEDRP